MEIGIYITANIIYLVRELHLGDRIGSFSLLERWVVATLFVGRHFPSVLWPIAGDVRRITCSFIALALDINAFCLRAELKVQFCTQRKRFEECAQNFMQWEGLMRPCNSSYYKMWAGFKRFDPRNNLVLGGVRVGTGCMNLFTAISKYTRVPLTLSSPRNW